MTTGSCDFRFHESLQGRTGGREGSKEVVGRVVRGVVIRHGADGDDVRYVTRGADGHRFGAIVSCRCNHDDASVPGGHDCAVHRVLPVMGHGGAAECQIQNPDVVRVLVGDYEGDCPDYIHVGPHALVVECLDDYQIDIRCYAVETTGTLSIQVFGFVAAGNHAGKVGAVSVLVIHRQGGSVLDGVIVSDNPFIAGSVFSDCFVSPGTRVDQGDGDAGSGNAFEMQLVSIYQRWIEGIAALALQGHIGVMSEFQRVTVLEVNHNSVVIRSFCCCIFEFKD